MTLKTRSIRTALRWSVQFDFDGVWIEQVRSAEEIKAKMFADLWNESDGAKREGMRARVVDLRQSDPVAAMISEVERSVS